MLTFRHLEDVLPAWREKIQPTLNKQGAEGITVGRNSTRVSDFDINRFLADEVTPVCLAWLREKGYWPNDLADMKVVQNEVESAILQLPLTRPELAEESEIPASRWAFPAAVGAGVGALLLSPVTWLSLGDRYLGLLLGAILGAFALVFVLAWLSKSPKFYAAIQWAVLTGAGGMAIGGLWRTIRGQSTGWLRGSLYFLAVWFVMSMLRPRRKVFSPSELWNREQLFLNQQLLHGADLVLAFSWSHPARLPTGQSVPPGEETLAPSICNLLSDLQAEITSGRDLSDLHDSVEALFQQFHDDGYEWRAVPKGSPFEESLREDYDTYGLIKPGEAVVTRRAALRRNGKVIQKGELRRAKQDERP